MYKYLLNISSCKEICLNQALVLKLMLFYKKCFLFVVAQVTETRTGPLGCSNYDNLDSVSSVLVQSPENKVQLQGLYDFLSLLF